MFGTVMRATVKPGKLEDLKQHFAEGFAKYQPYGGVQATLHTEDQNPNRILVMIHFKDRESYMANAQRPETDADYQKMLQWLEGEPEWIDVEVVASSWERSKAPTA